MGMDLVEITMRLEEVFHLHLDHEFWQSLLESANREDPANTLSVSRGNFDGLTALHLVDEIVRRLKLAGWYKEERSFDDTLVGLLNKLRTHYGRHDISPDTPLVLILIPKQDFEDWEEFTQLISGQLPDLIILGRWWNPFPLAILTGLAFGLGVGWWTESLGLSMLVGCGVGLFTKIVLWMRLGLMSQDSRCRRIPPQIETVQKLAEFLHQSRIGEGMTELWNERSVWTAIQDILIHCLSVPREQIVPSARLIQDLGMD